MPALDDSIAEPMLERPASSSTPMASRVESTFGDDLFSSPMHSVAGEIEVETTEFDEGARAASVVESSFEGEFESVFEERELSDADTEPALEEPRAEASAEPEEPIVQPSKETLRELKRLGAHNNPGLQEDERVVRGSRLRSRQSSAQDKPRWK